MAFLLGFPSRHVQRARSARAVPVRAGALALLLGLACVWSLAAARPAAAHAALDTSEPTHNAVLPDGLPADRATLRFTERLERSYSLVGLYDSAGQPVPGASFGAGADEYEMVLSAPPGLADGTYTMLWRTLSRDDGHTGEGYVTFAVGSQANLVPVTLPAISGDSGAPLWLQGAARWAALLGLAAALAVWPVWLLVLRPAISPAWQAGPRLTRRVQRFATAGVVLALAGSLFALLVQAQGVGESYLDGLRTTLTETRYGRLWTLRVALILAYAVALSACAWWWPRRRRPAMYATLALAAALPLPFALVAHASALTVGRTVAVGAHWLHALGAALWVGGLAVLLAGLVPALRDLTPAGRRVVLGRALPRFSALALAAWGVMGLTGFYSAWLNVGNLEALRETAYGRSLSLKLLLLLPALLLGGFNLLVLTDRLRRARSGEAATSWSRHFGRVVAVEVALVVVVLLVVGRLTAQQPARDELAGRDGRLQYELAAEGRTAHLAIAPGAAGLNHFRLEVEGAPLPAETRAMVRVELPERTTGIREFDLTRAAGNAFEWHGSELAIAGDWTLEVVVREPGQADWTVGRTVELGTEPPRIELPGPAWRFGRAGVAGLLLLALGIVGVVVAVAAGRTPLRRESAGLGTVAAALGLVFLLQSRVEPAALVASTNASVPRDEAAVARGAEIFAAQCVACHGAGGRGDGPAADPARPPADLTSAHAQSHQDADLLYWVTNGIQGSAMPAFDGTLSEAQIADVVAYVRSLQDQAGPGLHASVLPPSDCTVAPRTVAELDAFETPGPGGGALPPGTGTAEAGGGAGPPTVTATSALGQPGATPQGVPADAATTEGVTATVRLLVACSNARDTLRHYALFTDRFLAPSFTRGVSDVLQDMLATPPAALPQEVWLGIVAINEVRALPDGRATALVTLDNPATHSHAPGADPNQPTTETAFLVLTPVGERWLIDEVVQYQS